MDKKLVEVPGRETNVFQYSTNSAVMIPRELMAEHGIDRGGRAQWVTVIIGDDKLLCLRKGVEL